MTSNLYFSLRSAPLSPYSEGGAVGVRQRHMSAGHLPATSSHTIHYRPDSFDISPAAPGHTGQQYSNYTIKELSPFTTYHVNVSAIPRY